MQRTPIRLVPSDALPAGVTVVAGRSAPPPPTTTMTAARLSLDGESNASSNAVEVRAIVTAVEGAACSRVTLTVAGLGAGGPGAPQLDYTVTVVNSTDTNIMAVAGNASPSPGGELTIEFDLVAPAVASVRVAGPLLATSDSLKHE
jgi:hypothetical protein